MTDFQPFSLKMGTAAALVFVAFSGAIKVGAIGGEVMEPEETLPRGMIQSLVIATALYAAVAYIMVAAMDADWYMVDGHAVENPITVFAQSVAGTTVVLLASLVAIIAMASMALAGVLSSSRFIYAMAKDGVLPAPLGQLNERYQTPHWPILLTGVLMAVSIYSFDVHVIAELASGFILMVFIVLNLTVVVLRNAGPNHAWDPPYRSPLYPLPQIYGTAAGLALLILMGEKALYGGTGAILLGLLAWFAYGRRNVQPRDGPTPLSAFFGRADDAEANDESE
jgi:amino acid transporter